MNELEYAGLVLEDQLLDHLATKEGAMAIWKERLAPDLINESDEGIRDALVFVLSYIDKYGEAPSIIVLSEETGYEDFEEPIAPIEYVIDRLRERHMKRELSRAIKKVARAAGEPRSALSYMFSESARIIGETTSLKNVMDTYDADSVIQRYNAGKEFADLGLSYGFPEIDMSLGGGLQPNRLYVVVARTGRYKSWMLLKSAFETWAKGHNVTFHTLEMSPEEMLDRFLAMLVGISWRQFQNHALPPADLDLLEEAKHWLMEQEHRIYFVQNPIGERTVPHMTQTALQHGSSAMIVDQLSFIESTRDISTDQNWLRISFICQELKDATTHFPIFYAAQINRTNMQAKSVKDLDPSNIGLSDAVGNTADIVFGLYSNKDMMPNGIVQYGVVKSRSFSPRAWEMKVELDKNSNFRILDELDLESL